MSTAYELLEAFDAMIQASQATYNAMSNDPMKAIYPVFLPEGLCESQWTKTLFQDIWYEGNQDGRVTRNYYGILLVNDTLFAYFQKLNQCKLNFKSHSTHLKQQLGQDFNQVHSELAKRHPAYALILEKQGLARLHLKQCYRLFPLFEHPPTHVNFSWYQSGRSIQRITAAQAREALMKLDTESKHIQIQLSLLNAYANNAPLAKVQTQAPLLRANLRFDFRRYSDIKERAALNAALPIVCRCSPDELKRWPAIKLPASAAPSPQRQRALRNDIKIEQNPFLPSIRVHRYS
jgi:hypothetical protein